MLLVETAKQVHTELKRVSAFRYVRKLNLTIREHFTDKRLVVHSCRHSFKTISRAVGMPADISDELSGHAKASVSAVSDGYGSYPDELLIKESSKVWSYLNDLVRPHQ